MAFSLYNLSDNPENLPGYDKMLEVPEMAWNHFYESGKDDPEFTEELTKRESLWAKDPKIALKYIISVTGNPLPEAEPLIAKNAQYSYEYARIFKSRFKLGEPAIMADPELASLYARHFFKGRWPEAEPSIATDPRAAFDYAEHILRGEFPLGEEAISQEGTLAYHYVMYCLKPRPNTQLTKEQCQQHLRNRIANRKKKLNETMNLFSLTTNPEELPHFDKMMEVPEFAWNAIKKSKLSAADKRKAMTEKEHVWAKDAEYAFEYARAYLRKRFPAGEKSILTNAELAADYASEIIKGRWPEAEPIIARDCQAAYTYAREVMHGRFPLAEPLLASAAVYVCAYALWVINGRFPEGERTLLDTNKKEALVNYVNGVFKEHFGYIAARQFLLSKQPKSQIDEAMNLYSLTDDPTNLPGYDKLQQDPQFIYQTHFNDLNTLKKYEPLLAKDPDIAYRYALLRKNAAPWSLAKRFIAGEPAILTDPKLACKYAISIIGKQWPEAEEIIKTDPMAAYEYAAQVVNNTWPEAEPIIATNARASFLYAFYVLRDRFPAGEAVIAKDAHVVMSYVDLVLKKGKQHVDDARRIMSTLTETMNLYKLSDNPKELPGYDQQDEIPGLVWTRYKNNSKKLKELEHLWAKDPKTAYFYATRVLEGPFPAGEAAIATNADYAYDYAHYILDGRFPAGEATIAKSRHAVDYALDIVMDRWPEGENAIFSSVDIGNMGLYVYRYVKQRVPEAERQLAKSSFWICKYMEMLNLTGRWKDAEKTLASEQTTPQFAAEYVKRVFGRRLSVTQAKAFLKKKVDADEKLNQVNKTKETREHD